MIAVHERRCVRAARTMRAEVQAERASADASPASRSRKRLGPKSDGPERASALWRGVRTGLAIAGGYVALMAGLRWVLLAAA